jgi:hypothetical protein
VLPPPPLYPLFASCRLVLSRRVPRPSSILESAHQRISTCQTSQLQPLRHLAPSSLSPRWPPICLSCLMSNFATSLSILHPDHAIRTQVLARTPSVILSFVFRFNVPPLYSTSILDLGPSWTHGHLYVHALTLRHVCKSYLLTSGNVECFRLPPPDFLRGYLTDLAREPHVDF